MNSKVARTILFLFLLLFVRFDSNNYDNVDSSTIEWIFAKFPYIYFAASLVVLYALVMQLNIIILLLMLPMILLNSFELYNRFYFVIILGYLFLSTTGYLRYLLFLWLIIMQPINVFLLFIENRILFKFVIIFLVVLNIIPLSIDSSWFSDVLSYIGKEKVILNIIEGVKLKHEVGNFSYYMDGFSSISVLLFPTLYFGLKIGAVVFQFIPLLIAKYSWYIFLILVASFLLYGLATPNLASFYRNMIPLLLVYFLSLKKKFNSCESV